MLKKILLTATGILMALSLLSCNLGQNSAIVRIYCGWEKSNETHVGTGVIISKNGHIITAEHVIRGSKTIAVIASDGREYLADVVKKNNATDAALLFITTECLKDGTPNNSFVRNFAYLNMVKNSRVFVGKNFTVNAFLTDDSPKSFSGKLLSQGNIDNMRIRVRNRKQNVLYGMTNFPFESMQGMSGAPCLVGGQIIGFLLASSRMDTKEWGTFTLTVIQPVDNTSL